MPAHLLPLMHLLLDGRPAWMDLEGRSEEGSFPSNCSSKESLIFSAVAVKELE